MQTPKPRMGLSEVPQKMSPATPRTSRATKSTESESGSATSKSTPTKSDRSPKITERRSPRSPVTEKKQRPSRVTELECQLTQLQEDLKKTNEQLGVSESWRKQAQQEEEEARKQLMSMSAKLEDSQRQLVDFSAAEESRLQELRKISQERDVAWQSELEASHNHHSVDSAALATAMKENHRLKQQLEMAVKSEAAQAKQSEMTHSELEALKHEFSEKLFFIESLKGQLGNSERAVVEAQSRANETQQQLELAKSTAETLRSDGLKLAESFKSKSAQYEESKARVNSLLEIVNKLQASQQTGNRGVAYEHPEIHPCGSLEMEVEQLKSEIEAVEIKYREEQIQSTMEIQSAYELVDRVRIDSGLRIAELESALRTAKTEIFELKASLIDKETELQSISAINSELTAEIEKGNVNQRELELDSKLMKSVMEITELKANLMDKETQLQNISEENELLKLEMAKIDMERRKSSEAAITDLELARAAERDALMRLGCVADEADKSSRRAARVAEQLEAAQARNIEMEEELKKLRVQSDQWRKAAEAAAAALTPGNNNGRFVERTASLDYQSVAGKLMNSPFSDDMGDESPRRKSSNMMRRIGALWKKSPK